MGEPVPHDISDALESITLGTRRFDVEWLDSTLQQLMPNGELIRRE